MDDLTSLTDSYLEAKAVSATSSGAEGPDKPSATPPGGPGHQGPGGAALGPALDDEQTGRRGPYLCGPLGPTTGPGTRPGLGEKPHQGESGGAGEGYASQEPPGGWTPLGQVLR